MMNYNCTECGREIEVQDKNSLITHLQIHINALAKERQEGYSQASRYYNSGREHIVPDNVMALTHEGYVIQFGNIQSLEGIKERGGFGVQEILDLTSVYLTKYGKIVNKNHIKKYSKKGILFQDPVSGETYRVFEWFDLGNGQIRAVKKRKELAGET